MTASVFTARPAALALALASVFSAASHAQTGTPGSASLPETVVNATRFIEPSQALPLGVSVITAEDIRASGASTVNEALIRVLGVVGRQDSFGGGEYNIDLRGFGETADSNQVIIVDGVRLNESDSSKARLAGIAIDTVERIEVLRGGGAVLYGEGATGGAIVITTKAGLGKARRNAASVQAGAGSDRLRELRANATVAAGGFSVDVSGQKRKTDNYRDNFKSDTESASVAAQWSNEWLRFGARHSRDDLDAQLPGALSVAQFEADPRQSNNAGDNAQIRNERNGVFGEAQWGGWQLAADGGTRTKTLRSVFSGAPYDYDVDASSYGLRARNESSFGSLTNVLVVGHDYASWERDVLGASGSTSSQHSRAWYAKDDLILRSGTRISLGARTERIEKQDSGSVFTLPSSVGDRQHAYELGVSQDVGGGVTVYGRGGRSYRLPNVDEISFTSPGAVLVPQRSRDFEAGARWAHLGTKLEGRLYSSLIDHEIGYDPAAPGPFGPGANVNLDPTRRQGIEVDVSQAVLKQITVRANGTVRRSQFRSGPYEDRDVSLAPRRTASVRLDWSLAGHRVSGGVTWVDEQYADYANTVVIPSYHTADARYAYQWKAFEFALGVKNLFDRKYYSQAFVGFGGAVGVYPEAGRTYYATARAQF